MDKFLEQINSPDDLKRLSSEQLKGLATQIRNLIIASVGQCGGHLASNLGVVELTTALHYSFDFKKDKLLWDVGHQCYTHKILTGRKEGFSQLRQRGGISGFPNPRESEYDQFVVGHAGTAIATAIGMALGSRKDSDEKIVAMIGDASIVNGVSFEGLNNLGLVKRQLLIVLNDNNMAIDATQGALAKYFSKIRLSHTYEDLVKSTNNILEHLPVIGKGVEEAIERIKKSFRMVLPASQMFESLNIPYFGPVDGHDTASLVHLFDALGKLDHPAILHVYTKKGKGFSPAEENRSKYHSTGPFEVNGEAIEPDAAASGQSFTQVFGEHLVKLAEADEKIVAITSAMCGGTGLGEFREKFGERFYDVGIAESAAVDIAAGLAKNGMRPVVCIYSTFLQRGFDQIFQEVALQNLPVVFCIDRAGLVGADGATHHGIMDIGFLRMMPNMVLMAPANGVEMKAALDFAMGQSGPVAIRYPRESVPSDTFDMSACSQPFELGKSVVVRKGEKASVTIVSYGGLLEEVLRAAESLAGEGIETDVINARFAAPIDDEIISLFEKGKKQRIITVEDHREACGFGSAVLQRAYAVFGDVKVRAMKILAVPQEFIKQDSRGEQLMRAGLNADKIAEAAREILKS